MKTAKLNQEIVIQAHRLIRRVYLMEKGDGWLTCLLCGRQGDHFGDLVHKKDCWFNKYDENNYGEI